MPNFMIYENSYPVYVNIIGIFKLRRLFDIILKAYYYSALFFF